MNSKKLRILSCIVIAFILTLGNVFVSLAVGAYAGNDTTISTYVGDSTNTIPNSVKSNFDISSGPDTSKDANYQYYIRVEGGVTYYYYIENSKVDIAKTSIEKAKKSESVEDDIKNITDGLNIKADTETAVTSFQGFVPVLNTVLGAITTLVIGGLFIYCALDICYLAFPVFRGKCEEVRQSGNNFATKSNPNSAGGERQLRFISDDAQYAIVAANTVQTGKNPFAIYFKKRIATWILVVILIFILLTGNINIILNIVLKLVSGIIELISGI